MTLTKFDSRNIDHYNEPRFLVHFQWGTNEKVYRYALVETINTNMARTKLDLNKPKHVRIAKSTSIGRRPKMSSMNKNKKSSFKKYKGQGR